MLIDMICPDEISGLTNLSIAPAVKVYYTIQLEYFIQNIATSNDANSSVFQEVEVNPTTFNHQG